MALQETAPQGNVRPVSEDFRQAKQEARSLGVAAGAIVQELRGLVMLEAGLAQAEIADSTAAAKKAGMFGGFAGILGVFVLGFLALALMFGFDTFMPLWLAALATAGVLAVIAGIAALIAKRQMKDVSVTPKRTMKSIREDVRWASEQIKQNGM